MRLFSNNKIFHVTQIALLVAVMVILSYLRIPIGSVPIVLENLGIMLSALLLGSKRGTISVIIFIILRIIGIGGPGGIALLFSPVSGYIYGWLLIPAFINGLVTLFNCHYWLGLSVITALAGVILDDFVCGGIGLMIFSHLSLTAALTYNLSFLIGDVVKSIVAVALTIKLKESFRFRQLLK